MFWSFVQPTTKIDDLFNQEDLQLETLLEEDDLLQECKAHNSKLIKYFSEPEIIKKLLNYITNPPEELDELKKLKYSYLSCEILSCDIWPILDAIMDNTDALVDFWKFVDRDEPLEIFQASYFSKINLVLLQYKLSEMLQFIRDHPYIISKIIKHISSSPIADILIQLIKISECEEANGIIEWLQQEKVIPSLVSSFDPYLDDETHTNIANTLIDINSVSYISPSPLLTTDILTGNIDGVNSFLSTSVSNFGGNALVDELKSKSIVEQLVGYMLDENAPNSTSSLIHGTTVIIDLIRRYCGDIEQAEYQQHQYDHFQQECMKDENQYQDVVPPTPPTKAQFEKLSLALNDLLNVLGNNLEKFEYLLLHPKSINGPIPTTLGEVVPLGTERLRVCELFAEVIHLQYLYSSSPLFDRIVFEQKEGEEKRTLVEELITITDKFTERKMLPICLDLFFKFPWNNFLHSVVYDMIAKIFNTCSYLVTATNLTNELDDENQLSAEEQMFSSLSEETKERMNLIKNSVIKLTDSILDEGQLPQKIVEAQKLNDIEEKKEKGLRLGYMGHLTHISDEICKLMSKCSNQFSDKINAYINGKDWNDYINNSLQETKNRDCQALGGQRPNNDTITNISFGYQPQDFDYDTQDDQYRLAIRATGLEDDEEDINGFDMNEFENMITSANDRDSPERFFENSSEDEMDSSEEEEDWINGLDHHDLDGNILDQSDWTADFSDFDNHINGSLGDDDPDKLNDWANFDEAFSPDKINAVNVSTSSNDSRDENQTGLEKEDILTDLDNNNIVDTLNNLSLDDKEAKK